jgi:hypothetical protein
MADVKARIAERNIPIGQDIQRYLKISIKRQLAYFGWAFLRQLRRKLAAYPLKQYPTSTLG